MKKRKILASLMATGFAFGVGITTASVVNNNYNESANINIQDGFNLYENKLSENQLRPFNYNVKFNNMKIGFGVSNGDMWEYIRDCDYTFENSICGTTDCSIEEYKTKYKFDFITSIADHPDGTSDYIAVKSIYDSNGELFAVITQRLDNFNYYYDNDNPSSMPDELQEVAYYNSQECQSVMNDFHYYGYYPSECKVYISSVINAGKTNLTSNNYYNFLSGKNADISFCSTLFAGNSSNHQLNRISQSSDQSLGVDINNFDVLKFDKEISLPSGALDGFGEIISADLKIGLEINDNDTPVIKGQATYFFNVDTAKDFNYIKSTITAYDETEGDITNKLVFTNPDNYSLENLHTGSYSFTATVSDEAGHTASQNFNIVVKDVTEPNITASNKEQSYATCLSANEIKSLFTYSDNYNNISDLTFEIVSDDYTSKFDKVGSHNVTARVTDKSGNYKEATATITVVDNIAPVIACSNSYEISTTSSKNLTLDKLVSALGIVANDVIEGSVSVSLQDLDNYSNNLGKVGDYKIRAVASDSKGNTATTEFVLNVIDEDYPVIKVDSPYCIFVQEGELITEALIKQILIDSGQITSNEANTLHVESSVFEMNYLTSGLYSMKLSFADGRNEEISLNVNEAVSEDVKEPITKETFKTQMMSAIDNISNISEWNWINWVALGTGLIIILLVVSLIKRKFRK
ncbi:MAG: hypothetical protein IKP12_01900 [Acholeplasmatales bacterium]|nr:hypothetical protein [Acholeplasmatales bacterium]